MARAKALSAGQRWLLNQLDNGARLYVWNGNGAGYGSANLHPANDFGPSRINLSTADAMLKRGYLSATDSDWRRTVYTISAAGRLALEGK